MLRLLCWHVEANPLFLPFPSWNFRSSQYVYLVVREDTWQLLVRLRLALEQRQDGPVDVESPLLDLVVNLVLHDLGKKQVRGINLVGKVTNWNLLAVKLLWSNPWILMFIDHQNSVSAFRIYKNPVFVKFYCSFTYIHYHLYLSSVVQTNGRIGNWASATDDFWIFACSCLLCAQ